MGSCIFFLPVLGFTCYACLPGAVDSAGVYNNPYILVLQPEDMCGSPASRFDFSRLRLHSGVMTGLVCTLSLAFVSFSYVKHQKLSRKPLSNAKLHSCTARPAGQLTCL